MRCVYLCVGVTIGVVVLTLIVNIFRDKKIGYKSVFVMVSPLPQE